MSLLQRQWLTVTPSLPKVIKMVDTGEPYSLATLPFNIRKTETTNDFQDMVRLGLNMRTKRWGPNLRWVSVDVESVVHRRHRQVQQIAREAASQDVLLQVAEATDTASQQRT